MLSQKQDLRLLQPSLHTSHTVSFPVMLPNSKLGVIYLNEQALRELNSLYQFTKVNKFVLQLQKNS